MALPEEAKRQAILNLLSKGLTQVLVRQDAEGVIIPDSIRNPAVGVALNLSYQFQDSDLTVTDKAISQTLSFSGKNFYCVIPFEAIYGAALLVKGTKTMGTLFAEPVARPLPVLPEPETSEEKALARRLAFKVIEGGKGK
jgi:hypothetical protein